MSQSQKSSQEEPEYITYLLSPELKHDTYFLVGKHQVERIGAVRKMLAAHSAVFRAELQDSDIAEKGEIIVKDLFPDTFRNLLKFTYGYNNIASLTFEEADDLLYASDKYFMENLKKQLTLRLLDLLNSQNVCSLLNNPVCHNVLALNGAITKILQWETSDVLASSRFLHLRPEGFIKILEKDCLNVAEIELFKKALAWAESRVTSKDGNQLRNQFKELKHIRIRTFSLQDFLREVVPSGVLTSEEVVQSCILYGKDEKPPALDGFSDKTEPRSYSKHFELKIPVYSTTQSKSVSLVLNTKCSVGLLPLEVQANSHPATSYRCVCNVEISNESRIGIPPVTVKFNELVASGQIFKIPLEKNGMYFKFSPNTSYKINICFEEFHVFQFLNLKSISNNDITLTSSSQLPIYGYSNSRHGVFPFKSLMYVKSFPI